MELKIEEKMDTLFSFLKSHTKQKILIFVSSIKQVRYTYQAFKALKLSTNLFELHGKQHQNKRTAIYYQFVEKRQAVLICTDIAARGVDFPAVDWVIQLDAPEDKNTYIHRVGRTARYKSKGNALLFLLPSERAFVD
jgi:ATP-dependent RNA helicase DDX10/DBP4